MKKAITLLLIFCMLLSCTGCGAPHSCENPCESCGLCLNGDCAEAACQEKCQGHHACTSPCPDCGLCANESCTEAVCQKKCQGHHTCASLCPDCGLCANESCTEAVCQKKCQGHHTCASLCPDCGLCANESCTEAVCQEKCPGHNMEEPYLFSSGDYITTEAVSIDTGTFVYDIGPGIYVRGDLQEITDVIVPLMEQFTGLDFDGAGYGQEKHPDGKIHINLSRDYLYVELDWYQGNSASEVGNAYADAYDHAIVSPGDLYLGTSTIIHEASHVLMYRQSEWQYSQLLNEGISTYTTYLVERELEMTDPETSFCISPSSQSIGDMQIYDYDKLYEQPLEYWFKNTFEYSGNANYVIGFRFMAYLQEVYGNYTGWITKFEEMYPYTSNRTGTNEASVSRQIEVLKATYGEDVLDNFYPWLKENQARFDPSPDIQYSDMTTANGVNLYPTCNYIETRARMVNFIYSDLYINLETVRTYLADYKQLDISGLTLFTSQPVTVNLYQADGSFTTVTTDSDISLEGISYIKLVGTGTLNLLEIKGPFRYYE